MSKMTSRKNFFLLDNFSFADILNWNQRQQDIADYGWSYYSHIAHQRSFIFNELKDALASECRPLSFSSWQRVVNYQYGLNPLSARGSVLNDPGGRFNIGSIDQTKFPQFAALYIAEDRETAYKEKFGLYQKKTKHPGLSMEDLMLTGKDSVVIVSLHGEINQALDLTDLNALKKYFNLIKEIVIPNELCKRAIKLNIEMKLPKSHKQLLKSLLQVNWRRVPMIMGIPADSQILGQVAYAAGIEAILYPSIMSAKSCLAIYPNNFLQSNAYVELEGDIPLEVRNRRLDFKNYENFI